MNAHSVWKRWIISTLGAFALLASIIPVAQATDLPPGVLTYVRQKDPRVKIRFDGLVLFSNGESYVPVIPQDPALNPDSQQVIATVPEKAPYPDLIQFDNNFFLMRMIQTSTGRLTFPKMTDYPLQLKEGLLPQDFVMPNNLFIPVELKIILGALPYNPSYTAQPAHSVIPLAVSLNTTEGGSPFKSTARQTYVFDLTEQKVLAIDPITGVKSGEVAVNCAPSSLKLSPDGKLLFVPCLASNELVAVDTASNLIKTRIPVGQRPDAVVYVYPTKEVVISNRYSSFLSVIDSVELLAAKQIDLGQGTGGAMALIPGEKTPKLVVADAFKPMLYIVNLSTRMVEKIVKALPEISALTVVKNEKGEPEIWVVSRTKSQIMALDMDGKILMNPVEVGHKPIDLVAYDHKILVLSAGDSQIQMIDRQNKTFLSTIPLEAEGFPSGIVAVPSEKLAYITMAASNHLVVLNLESGHVENTLPVTYRAGMIGMMPDKTEVAQYTVEPQSALKAPEQNLKKPANPVNAPVSMTERKTKPQGMHQNNNVEKTTGNSINKNETNKNATIKNTEQPVKLDSKGIKQSIRLTQPATMPSSQSTLNPTSSEAEVDASPQTGNTVPGANGGGKFKLNLIKLGRQEHEPEELEEKQKAMPSNAKMVSPKSGTAAPQKTTEPNQPKQKEKDAAQQSTTKQAVETYQSKSVDNPPSNLPVKAGVRVEQKPLAMPLDLPAENTFSIKKPADTPAKMPVKTNKP